MEIALEPIARKICDSYGLILVGKVGEGAFKETFEVRDSVGSSEALKVFRKGRSTRRSKREIEAMIRCHHPNISKLHDVSTFEHNGERYLFTIEEFLPGGTLTQRLEKGCLSRKEIISLGTALAGAIRHIATHALVHRDLKPDNIMFRDDQITPVVVDFGLVRDLGSESLTQTWLAQGPGSPYFSAPEQLNNEKHLIDWRADQFALGVVLTIAAMGYHPYARTGDSSDDVVTRVASREPLEKEFERAVVELGLQPLVRMLSPWPVLRFRAPQELVQAWEGQTKEVDKEDD